MADGIKKLSKNKPAKTKSLWRFVFGPKQEAAGPEEKKALKLRGRVTNLWESLKAKYGEKKAYSYWRLITKPALSEINKLTGEEKAELSKETNKLKDKLDDLFKVLKGLTDYDKVLSGKQMVDLRTIKSRSDKFKDVNVKKMIKELNDEPSIFDFDLRNYDKKLKNKYLMVGKLSVNNQAVYGIELYNFKDYQLLSIKRGAHKRFLKESMA
ncbi:MAG: hypothetical protein WC307_03915 [Candidatus Nanoarchaeia archaeon]